ncbi:hypothetical protein E4U42_005943 [Claviceps africana]|uniref:Aminoglycoside phosphotransferase domain-containing protein n=1 Tax=Claviceps africana TaxID=83212 RepID=A0A8K0J386_9HYPO|nr:hypothetical protein E4U42_005943 [Claviceps africana]
MPRLPKTYEDAINQDTNILHEAQYYDATFQQFEDIRKEEETIMALTRHHVGVESQTNVTIDWKGVIIGAFNICFPIAVERPDEPPIKLFFRCAMPHKLGELRSAGAVDEKMRCEVATYAWIQEKCPDIRIPHLYGFGLFDHSQFTNQSQRPLLTRVILHLRRLFLTWLRPSIILSPYIPHPSQHRFSTAYMVLEDVSADGSRMVYKSWAEKGDDERRRHNLYRGYAKVVISLARVPQPRIGSFRFHSDGTISLSNRPLTTTLAILENDGMPRCIPRDRTYTNADLWVSDMLSFHAGRLSTDVNAALHAEDLRFLMGCQVVVRALAHHYVHPERREGPFYLQFTDLHRSNIFVDDDWNIRSLVDLEWVTAHPLEMMQAPYWLVDGDLATFEGEQLESFKKRRLEYMEIFEDEERKAAPGREAFITNAINWSWERKGSWFWIGIESLNTLRCMLLDHVRWNFGFPFRRALLRELSLLWCADSDAFVEKREKDIQGYQSELRKLYGERKAAIEESTEKTGHDAAKEQQASKEQVGSEQVGSEQVGSEDLSSGKATTKRKAPKIPETTGLKTNRPARNRSAVKI